jgi:hypothetical protein
MESKLIGLGIDKNQHSDMLKKFTEFICNYTPLLDSIEKYYQNLSSIKLLENDNTNNLKIEILEELTNVMTKFIPMFLEFSILENKLDKLNNS